MPFKGAPRNSNDHPSWRDDVYSIFVVLGGLGVVRDFFQTANLSVGPTMLIFMLITFIAGFVLEFISIMISCSSSGSSPASNGRRRCLVLYNVFNCNPNELLDIADGSQQSFLAASSSGDTALDMYRGVVPLLYYILYVWD